MATVFGFPNPVNEKAARVVAAGVAMLAAVLLVTGWHWLIGVLALGFLLRVLAGPRWSLLGQLATKVVAPHLGPPRLVPGPPKRFAQSIGFVLSSTAAVVSLGAGERSAATALIAVLFMFALLESVAGFCAGCWVFRLLMRLGVIPVETCEACRDIWARDDDGARPVAAGTPS